jgi:hypothetical protein
MVENPDINSLILMFRYYENHAKQCFDIYKDLAKAYFMYDYYMEMAGVYEQAILSHI